MLCPPRWRQPLPCVILHDKRTQDVNYIFLSYHVKKITHLLPLNLGLQFPIQTSGPGFRKIVITYLTRAGGIISGIKGPGAPGLSTRLQGVWLN